MGIVLKWQTGKHIGRTSLEKLRPQKQKAGIAGFLFLTIYS
jgi:hypothetical protein